IFDFFTSKNIALLLKKSYITYPNIKLLKFKINALDFSIFKKRLKVFKNLKFLNTLKLLKKYIKGFKFIRYLLLYY
ncbi:hypothetical protein B0T20DRAFT_317163, partial [Sordaria brevicollis]